MGSRAVVNKGVRKCRVWVGQQGGVGGTVRRCEWGNKEAWEGQQGGVGGTVRRCGWGNKEVWVGQ